MGNINKTEALEAETAIQIQQLRSQLAASLAKEQAASSALAHLAHVVHDLRMEFGAQSKVEMLEAEVFELESTNTQQETMLRSVQAQLALFKDASSGDANPSETPDMPEPSAPATKPTKPTDWLCGTANCLNNQAPGVFAKKKLCTSCGATRETPGRHPSKRQVVASSNRDDYFDGGYNVSW
eukprot:TRINITY_DN51498_c0_g1_i2.p1 TRINITY_DN51498_c0_g1~~TRINITY_DN51498_c0_g1_i2.p1  ORF type:complete len:182 (-),score=43.16 TRINITY_DN51498_c0_g1_i2:302-847(-)